LSAGDAIVAIGNALGRFGTPSAVAGRVEALGRTITAGSGVADRETLTNMIQIAASIEPGDSGGPLVTTDGVVVGINTAADTGTGRFGYTAGTTGFAIPIEKAMGIARQIQSGTSTSRVHVGPRALLGIVLEDSGTRSGAVVADVPSGTPADDAGISPGDVIVAVEGRSVNSAAALRSALDRYRPGDKVRVTWVDDSGRRQQASVTLTEGPPA
jgi:S1-C subfamily serine protease